MKRLKFRLLAFTLIIFNNNVQSSINIDSLLQVLDKSISERAVYVENRENLIHDLKLKKQKIKDLDELYEINKDIIHQYESFKFDSTEQYIRENLSIAVKTENEEYFLESNLQLALVYSMSGLFVQAVDLLNSVNYKDLPTHLKVLFCWSYIRYYENLAKYTDDVRFTENYLSQKDLYRSEVVNLQLKVYQLLG